MNQKSADDLPIVSEKCVNCDCVIHIDITKELQAKDSIIKFLEEELSACHKEHLNLIKKNESLEEKVKERELIIRRFANQHRCVCSGVKCTCLLSEKIVQEICL